MLSDDKTYKKLKRDPALALERKMNSLLLSLKRAGSLPDVLYYRLRSSAKTTPLLYGLPKIHKPNTPLRPIVSFINSPTYILSKHLVTILSPLVGNSSTHVKNSFDFAKFISTQCIPSGTVLASFDVVSLFTTIPTKKAVDVARQRLSVDSTLEDHTALSVSEVTQLLEFCLNATYLSYNNKFFRQTFGTAMGSPVSVTVDNLVMEDIEDKGISTYPSPPPF